MFSRQKTRVRLARKITFSSAHRYYHPRLSEEENLAIYGSQYSPHGHGHNFILEVHVDGPVDPQTGLVINLKDLDAILKKVTSPLDHHHLNYDVPYFQEHVPTTENIARYCFEAVSRELEGSPVHLHKVRLYEGEDLWVDYGQGL